MSTLTHSTLARMASDAAKLESRLNAVKNTDGSADDVLEVRLISDAVNDFIREYAGTEERLDACLNQLRLDNRTLATSITRFGITPSTGSQRRGERYLASDGLRDEREVSRVNEGFLQSIWDWFGFGTAGKTESAPKRAIEIESVIMTDSSSNITDWINVLNSISKMTQSFTDLLKLIQQFQASSDKK